MNRTLLRGFSLLELTIVLLIISVLAGSTVTLLIRYVEGRQQVRTLQTIEVIKKALMDYRTRYNRLPCPAVLTYPVTHASFGSEGGAAGACENTIQLNHIQTVKGGVTTKALGLSDDHAFDGWGNRILYALDKRTSSVNAFTTYSINNTTVGALMVVDANGTVITNKAIFILVSHGANGHGAYSKSGAMVNANSTDWDELNNCNCTSGGIPATEDRIFVQKAPSEHPTDSTKILFDDIVDYMVRSQVRRYGVE